MISGGDIKAVQGTTGHASADMLVNTYAHIQQSSRVELGKKFESGFCGAMEGTRTPGLLIRSQSLYPAELPTHTFRSEHDVFYH